MSECPGESENKVRILPYDCASLRSDLGLCQCQYRLVFEMRLILFLFFCFPKAKIKCKQIVPFYFLYLGCARTQPATAKSQPGKETRRAPLG